MDLGLNSVLYSWMSDAPWDVVKHLGHLWRAAGHMVQVWEVHVQLLMQVSWDASKHLIAQQRFTSEHLNPAQLPTGSGAEVISWGSEQVTAVK